MSAQEELKRLLHTDGVIPAANTSGDRATNKYWVWQTHITDNTNRIRAIHEQSIPALAEEIKKIQTNLANLSSTGITPEQETRIVERILDGLSTRLQS